MKREKLPDGLGVRQRGNITDISALLYALYRATAHPQHEAFEKDMYVISSFQARDMNYPSLTTLNTTKPAYKSGKGWDHSHFLVGHTTLGVGTVVEPAAVEPVHYLLDVGTWLASDKVKPSIRPDQQGSIDSVTRGGIIPSHTYTTGVLAFQDTEVHNHSNGWDPHHRCSLVYQAAFYTFERMRQWILLEHCGLNFTNLNLELVFKGCDRFDIWLDMNEEADMRLTHDMIMPLMLARGFLEAEDTVKVEYNARDNLKIGNHPHPEHQPLYFPRLKTLMNS